MIHLQVDPLLDVSFDVSPLETVGNLVIEQVKPGQESDLSIILTTDKKIKELNRDYRKMDEITDVLSFPSMEIDPDSGKLYLGDVIISLPLAEKQADSAGHSLMAELNLLVVHGVLHLLGYDHGTIDDKKIMWSFQDTILKELGLSGIKIIPDQE